MANTWPRMSQGASWIELVQLPIAVIDCQPVHLDTVPGAATVDPSGLILEAGDTAFRPGSCVEPAAVRVQGVDLVAALFRDPTVASRDRSRAQVCPVVDAVP